MLIGATMSVSPDILVLTLIGQSYNTKCIERVGMKSSMTSRKCLCPPSS